MISVEERQLIPENLLSQIEITNCLVRAADEIVSMQLIGGNDSIEHAQTFKKRLNESYLQKLSSELLLLINTYPHYHDRKTALTSFLSSHWQKIKNTNLSYTALPEHPATQLLITIAKRLSLQDNKTPIEILMPGVITESISEHYLNLDKLELSVLLKSHILASNQHYLLPIKLLLTATDPNISPSQISQQLPNPYYDYANAGQPYLCETELRHLYHHSEMTLQLHDSHQQYLATVTDKSNLLGQLNILCQMLSVYGAQGGFGSEEDAAANAYPAIMSFMNFYTELNLTGLYRSKQKPTLSQLPIDRQTAYIFVTENSEQGLYYLNKFDESVQLICTLQKKLRYCVNLLKVSTFIENEIRQNQLSTTHPTLIKEEVTEHYYLYGKKHSAEGTDWHFTKINVVENLAFPKEKNRTITLSLGNVPETLYEAIEKENAHHSQSILKDFLIQNFPKNCQTCTLEQLNLIKIHTTHNSLLEFKQVPSTIRKQISNLWDFAQNPTKNISATITMETCIDTIRQDLMPEIAIYEKQLQKIGLAETQKQEHYQKSLTLLNQHRTTLKNALYNQTYKGMDPLTPTPAILNYLETPLIIQSYADLKWLLNFPPTLVQTFLSDETNLAPKQYLQNHCTSLENIIILLIDTPKKNYGAFFNALLEKRTLNGHELGALLAPLPIEKCQSALNALGSHLNTIISDSKELNDVFSHLNYMQSTLVLNATINNLTNLIKTGEDLGFALANLNEIQKTFIYGLIENKLKKLIHTSKDLTFALMFLNEIQKAIIFELIKNDLTKLIKTGEDFALILECLNKTQIHFVFELVKDKFANFTFNSLSLDYALQYLDETQRTTLFNAVKHNLKNILIFANYEFFICPSHLNKEQNEFVLNVVINLMNDKYKADMFNSKAINRDFSHSNEVQRTEKLALLKGKLNQVILEAKDLGLILQHLNQVQCEMVLHNINENLRSIFRETKHIAEVLNYLNASQCKALFLAIQKKLPAIIKNNDDLKYFVTSLNNAQRSMLFNNREFVLMAMSFNSTYYHFASERLKQESTLKVAFYMPMLTYVLLLPESSKLMMINLAIVLVALLTPIICGLTITSLSLALTTGTIVGALCGGALGFFNDSKRNKESTQTAEVDTEQTSASPMPSL